MRIRLLTGAVLLAAVVPTVAVAAPGGTAGQLDRARQQLTGAQRTLEQVEAQLDRAQDQLSDVESRLSTASAELNRIRTDLEAAEAALAEAVARERAVATRLQAANQVLDGRVDAMEEHRTALEDRVADLYKHGRASTGQLLVRGVAESSDLHEVSVTVRTVEELVERDRDLLRRDVQATRATVDARAEVAAQRAEAVREQRAVAREQRRIAQLAAAQERTVARIDAERQERAAILASLEGDRVAKAALVDRLQQQVSELSATLSAELFTTPVDLPMDGPMPAWASDLPAHGRPWAPAIEAAAARVGIDGRLLAALVWTESNFRPAAVSHAGAIGLAQLMPDTAAGLRVDPTDPLQNLMGGARYLRSMLDRFGSAELGLAAYNAGPGRVERAGGIPDIVETQLYVVRVLERYERLVR